MTDPEVDRPALVAAPEADKVATRAAVAVRGPVERDAEVIAPDATMLVAERSPDK